MSDFNHSEATIPSHIREISMMPTLIRILSESIFSEIIGHQEIKEALLYQLVSGGILQIDEKIKTGQSHMALASQLDLLLLSL